MDDRAILFWIVVGAVSGVVWVYGKIRGTSTPTYQGRATLSDIGGADYDDDDDGGDGGD